MGIEMETDTCTQTTSKITINKVAHRGWDMEDINIGIKDSRTISLKEEEEIISHVEETTVGSLPVVMGHPHFRISHMGNHLSNNHSGNLSTPHSSTDNKATVSTIAIMHGTIIVVEVEVTILNLNRGKAVASINHDQV